MESKTRIGVEDGDLVIRVPMRVDEYNHYMGDDPIGQMDNICGVIEGDEMGFANWISMDYAGKSPQVSTMFYSYWGDKEEFRALCKKLGIEVVEYPTCYNCGKALFGSFTMDERGDLCWTCNEKIEAQGLLQEELTKERKNDNG